MVVGIPRADGGGHRGGPGELALFGGTARRDPRSMNFLRDRVEVLLQILAMEDSDFQAAPTGLTPEQMERYCPSRPRPNAGDGICSICLEPELQGEMVRNLPCGHALHNHCCEAWLSNAATCPVCRSQIVRK